MDKGTVPHSHDSGRSCLDWGQKSLGGGSISLLIISIVLLLILLKHFRVT